jgi:arginyl-tRNA--protein-N-Asp/Glu arginylyltransferase
MGLVATLYAVKVFNVSATTNNAVMEHKTNTVENWFSLFIKYLVFWHSAEGIYTLV